jgi:acetyl esterase/lipase
MKRRFLSLILALVMVFAVAIPASAATAADPLSISDASKTKLNVTVDGKALAVDWYVDSYLAAPNNPDNQKINVFVPATATKDSAVVFFVENGGWMSNSYAGAAQIKDGQAYVSTADAGKDAVIGRALAEGYVIVSYGARGRNDNGGKIGDEFACHSPATMTDTKAAVRFLRYNAAALNCDLDKIVITGTSGGGALSTVIAASGNSEDYFESLYEIGAAGVSRRSDGTYASTVRDDVFAVIAYCPITDLGHADQAYEWMYGDTRAAYAKDGLKIEDFPSGGMGAPTSTDQIFGDAVMAASKELAAGYVTYFDALGLVDEAGKALKAGDGSFKAAIEGLLEASVEKEFTTGYPSSDAAPADGVYDWLTIKDGKADIDMPGYLYWIGTKMTGLKTAPAFSNKGTPNAHPMLNEDNIFGSKADAYSPFEFWSWNNHTGEGSVGKNNTGLTWDEYLKTDAGAYLLKQIRMTNAIEYINDDTAGINIAPYWYVRHGMGDRDTAFPVAASMYYSLLANDAVEEVSFNYAWLKGHGGNYDVQEAYDWLDSVIAIVDPAVVVSNQALTLNGSPVACEKYNINGANFFKLRDLAMLLNETEAQFAVDFDAASFTVDIATGEAYVPAGGELTVGADQSATCVKSAWTVYVDGVKADVLVYNMGGNNYFKLRDLGEVLGFDVDYIAETRTATIEAGAIAA